MMLQSLPVTQSPNHLSITFVFHMSKTLARKILVEIAAGSAVESNLFLDKISVTHIYAEKL